MESNKDNYSETTISLKDGRLNLLLNAGAKGRTQGLIHGRSGTGQSFYFEPLEAVEGNNALQEALDAETQERQRILNELIDQTREHLDGIRLQLSILADLDALQSVRRFAQMGECSIPTVSERVELQLIQARHPLLDPAYAELREGALGTPARKREVGSVHWWVGRGTVRQTRAAKGDSIGLRRASRWRRKDAGSSG